ncbi:IE2 protein, putative [Trichomonas vaginalis G3]|uniref:IE2 protein, putative n=1 Tax=Trichomonas vaginalis (strain ATCC PRA-98 / G3) TaxID=412133 RepID=A2EVS3_TRIV3|nr:hypothetical protein TVAGG3_0414160 [Trichomonas vaginalis G3]EAY03283.1 IE2 protein, putative [Trichomonas vaginalis G3]KAI5535562.1 hypothetical protein TVAGG3_0414160 [Trichomonas vaginalis G3]|eukprot:XP_001315506.1 IE2 protein [Trichomonas vaginalis G3]
MSYKFKLELDNNSIDCSITIINEGEMKIEANDPINYQRWQGLIGVDYFNKLASKTVIRDPKGCAKIVKDSLELKIGCDIKLKYAKDFEQTETITDALLLIISINKYVNINLPFLLLPKPYSMQELVDIIKDLKKNQGSGLAAENKIIQKQLYEQAQAFFVEKQDLNNQIQKLQQENKDLKEELSKKEKLIRTLQEPIHTKAQTSTYTNRRSASPRSNSLVERQKQLERSRQNTTTHTRQISGPYKTKRSESANSRSSSARNSARNSARSSAAASRNNSVVNSRNSSRNNSVNSSRRNSAANSSNSSRNSSARSSRSSTPTHSRPSSRSGNIPFKRFDPTEWKRQKDSARRSASPARKSFY